MLLLLHGQEQRWERVGYPRAGMHRWLTTGSARECDGTTKEGWTRLVLSYCGWIGIVRDIVTPKDHMRNRERKRERTTCFFIYSHLPTSYQCFPLARPTKGGLDSVVCRGPGPVMQDRARKGKNHAENKQEITSIPYFLNVIFFPDISPGSAFLLSPPPQTHSSTLIYPHRNKSRKTQ